MTARPAWPIDTSVVSEVTCLRSGPSVAGLLDSIADEDSALGCGTGSPRRANTCRALSVAVFDPIWVRIATAPTG